VEIKSYGGSAMGRVGSRLWVVSELSVEDELREVASGATGKIVVCVCGQKALRSSIRGVLRMLDLKLDISLIDKCH
jgi:hypothetical protein